MSRNPNPNPARHHEWLAPDGNFYELLDLPQNETVLVTPTPEDSACATPRNPYQCALAQWSKRTTGAPAKFGVTIAIIPMFRRGKLVMFRCRVPAETARAIDHFDKTGEFPRGGFPFKGISPSNRIESKRATAKRHRERWGERRDVSGKKAPDLHLRNAARGIQVFIREDRV